MAEFGNTKRYPVFGRKVARHRHSLLRGNQLYSPRERDLRGWGERQKEKMNSVGDPPACLLSTCAPGGERGARLCCYPLCAGGTSPGSVTGAYLFATFLWHSCLNPCQGFREMVYASPCRLFRVAFDCDWPGRLSIAWSRTRWDSMVLLSFPTLPPGRHLLVSSSTAPPLVGFLHLLWEEPFLPPVPVAPVHVSFSAVPCG